MGKRKDKEAKELEERRAAFELFYSNIYKERWPLLKESLLKDSEPKPYDNGLIQPYFLDEASVIAASALPLKDGDHILDMCAAPGGKTLVLATRADNLTITANDRSRDRKARLDKVIEEHLPAEKRLGIETRTGDASLIGLKEPECYDAVLLDAPCSSERHVIQSEKHLAMWSPSRPKRLAIEQFSLLCSALSAVRHGGYILYSTCSLNPAEDEGVIHRLLERRNGQVEEIKTDEERGEAREHGRIILPDTAAGLGPIYYALLRKL